MEPGSPAGQFGGNVSSLNRTPASGIIEPKSDHQMGTAGKHNVDPNTQIQAENKHFNNTQVERPIWHE